jgi:hypothetical protein
MNRLPLFIILTIFLLPVLAQADWPTDTLAHLDAEQRTSEIAFAKSDFKALLTSQHRLTLIRRQANNHQQVALLSPAQQTAFYKRLELRDEYAIKWLAIAVYAMEASSAQTDREELVGIQREQLYLLRDIDNLLNR